MKPTEEMTIGEIEYLVHIHEWLSEDERKDMFATLAKMRAAVNLIIQRAANYRPQNAALACDCHYCETAEKRPKKSPPVHFPLD